MAFQSKVLIVFYSLSGHVETLAKEIKAGCEAAGAKAVLRRVPETLSTEVLEKMRAPVKDTETPIATMADLSECDGIIFGFPTRFGMAAAQAKAFIDATGGLWQKGALVGKPAAIFVSTATQGGGQETTALTWLTQLVHHGMLFVPLGYSTSLLFDMTAPHGGSPYGAGTFAGGDGSRQPTDLERQVARHQGTHFAGIVGKLVRGKERLSGGAAPAATNATAVAEETATAGEATAGGTAAAAAGETAAAALEEVGSTAAAPVADTPAAAAAGKAASADAEPLATPRAVLNEAIKLDAEINADGTAPAAIAAAVPAIPGPGGE